MVSLIKRRTALKWGGAALLSALLSPQMAMGGGSTEQTMIGAVRSYRLPMTLVPDGGEVAVPQDFLTALAPDGCAQWAAFRSFDRPALVLFPALDIETVESLVESPDSITGEELVSLVLADAREVMRGDRPFGVATLDHDLIAHADLSDVVDLVQFPGYGLLLAPSADGIRLYHPDIAI